MREIPLHGMKAAGRVAIVDDDDYESIARYRWWVWEVPEKNWGPYAQARVGTGRKAPKKYMHQLITGEPLTDHANHNGLDNQRHNLRAATRRQNLCNQRPLRKRASRYKGVAPVNGKWVARIRANNKNLYLGRYANEMDAALAYDVAARKHYGEFACPNFPEGYAAMVKFYMDGPHDPDSTRKAADLVAEGVRYLNYATLRECPGLENPADAYELIADLYITAQRLPQLLTQVRDFLAAQAQSGTVADSRGLSAVVQASIAGGALITAAGHAGDMERALRDAQNAISGLYVKEDGDG